MKIPYLNLEPMHAPIRTKFESVFGDVLRSNWFILGEKLQVFEDEYASFSGTNYAVGLSNGLDALILALKVLGIGPGDEVIVPSNTYIATVLAVIRVGAIPIMVEPRIETYNIDPSLIPTAITKRTKAIIPVHLYGQACEMDAIMDIAKEYNLFIVEDNAQAHRATFKGKLTGSWGHVNATSFYPGKNLGALGDAGAITTDNYDFAYGVKRFRNYGSTEKYQNEVLGYNNRLDEIQAAFLSVKLKYVDEWIKQRQQIASWYNQLLIHSKNIQTPIVHPDSSHSYHIYAIRTNQRDRYQKQLSDCGIGTLIHYPIPPHLQGALKFLGYNEGDFPIAEELAKSTLSLPLWPGLSEENINYICSVINAE